MLNRNFHVQPHNHVANPVSYSGRLVKVGIHYKFTQIHISQKVKISHQQKTALHEFLSVAKLC